MEKRKCPSYFGDYKCHVKTNVKDSKGNFDMKKKQFENGQLCTIDGVTCCYSDLIWQERNTCAYNERGRYPDNVMIHPAHKSNVYDEVESMTAYTMDRGRMTHYFGMKVIWTDNIGEDEIICTYNGRYANKQCASRK